MNRGQFATVTAVSNTEVVVDTGSGRSRLTLGDDGKAKVEGL